MDRRLHPQAIDPEALLANARFVRALVRSVLDDRHLADDAAQQTLLVALEHPPKHGRSLRAWLAIVAQNLARRIAARARRRVAYEQGAAQPEALPATDTLVERGELLRAVVEAALALAEPARSTILLHYLDDVPLSAIARRAKVPLETVRTRHKRALADLRCALARTYGRREELVLLALPTRKPVTASYGTASVTAGVMIVTTKLKIAAMIASVAVVAWLGLHFATHEHRSPIDHESVDHAQEARSQPSASGTPTRLEVAAEPRNQKSNAAASAGIAFSIVDDHDAPINGARIMLTPELRAMSDAAHADRIEARSDDTGLARLPTAVRDRCRWLCVTHATHASELRPLADLWPLQRDDPAPIKIVLHALRMVQVHVADPFGVLLSGARILATAAWGSEARAIAGDGPLAQLLSPEAITDERGDARLTLSPCIDYMITVTHEDHAAHERALDATISQVDVVLEPILVAGVQVLGAAHPRFSSSDLLGEHFDHPEVRIAIDRCEAALKERLAMPGLQLFFATIAKDGKAPREQDLGVGPPASISRKSPKLQHVRARFRRPSEFERSDVVVVTVPERIIDNPGAVRIRFRDEQGNPIEPKGSWCLRGAERIDTTAMPQPLTGSSDELAWVDLEPGSWQLVRRRPFIAFLRPPGNALTIDVTPGSSQVLSYTMPQTPLAQLELKVMDRWGREIENYGARLKLPTIGSLTYRELDIAGIVNEYFPCGACVLHVSAPGYAAAQTELVLQDGPNATTVTLDFAPKGAMTIRR